jgi:uncharacterized protein (DUF427 family)
MYVWEKPYYPYFYVPIKDVDATVLSDGETLTEIKEGGESTLAKIHRFPKSPTDGQKSTDIIVFTEHLNSDLRGLVRFAFGDMGKYINSIKNLPINNFEDQWYEEDTPIYVHPKDPNKRIFILSSLRPLEIRVDGTVVARTNNCFHLIESTLPVRYYVPLTSIVDPSMLRHSKLRTGCPYKGEAEYYDLVLPGGKTYENLIWYYRYPSTECAAIAGALCFFNDKVEILLDYKQAVNAPK